MAVNAYVNDDDQITAEVNNIVTVPNSWSEIDQKPFESVDNDTLIVSNGILKFSKGSYKQLTDIPSIENVTLEGNKTFAELGLEECSILDIKKIFS